MKTGLQQHAALSQQLRINPRLYQAMDLLYMPLLDLQQHLKQELLGNPFLELLEPEDETEVPLPEEAKEDKKEAEKNDEPNWEEILLDDGGDQGAPPRDMSEAREYVEPVPVETKDLTDHLREQMRLLDLTPRQQLLAEEFIGNIAEDGYLGATLEEIVNGVNQVLQAHADCASACCCSSRRGAKRTHSPTAWSGRPSTTSRRIAGAISASGSVSTRPRCRTWPTTSPSSIPSPACSTRPPTKRTSFPIWWSRRSAGNTRCS
jgi:hypothetical protein